MIENEWGIFGQVQYSNYECSLNVLRLRNECGPPTRDGWRWWQWRRGGDVGSVGGSDNAFQVVGEFLDEDLHGMSLEVQEYYIKLFDTEKDYVPYDQIHTFKNFIGEINQRNFTACLEGSA